MNDVFLYVYPTSHPLPPDDRLRRCAADFARQQQLPFRAETPIVRTQRGKPSFLGEALFFSVTHSGDYWICGISGASLGIDLQEHRPCKQHAIARRYFHPLEQAYLERQGEDAFFSLWTAKESYVKFTGQGIAHSFARFSTVDEQGHFSLENAELRFVPFQPEYSLCICCPQLGKVELLFP